MWYTSKTQLLADLSITDSNSLWVCSSTVTSYKFDKSRQYVGLILLEVDFLQKKNVDNSPYDSDKMAAEFLQSFSHQAFSAGQQVTTPLILLVCPLVS